MNAPAYDLRSNARTSGNPDRLPRRWRMPMVLMITVLAGSLVVFAAARVAGILLEKQKVSLVSRNDAITSRVANLDAQLAAPRYLNSRAWTIFGGSNEVQANIIAKTVLGLG